MLPISHAIPSRRLATVVVLLALAGSGLCSAVAGKRGAFPYGASVEVVAGDARLPASLAEELQRGIARELAISGCFREIVAQPESADFVIRVFSDEFEQLTEYQASVTERATAFDPNVKNLLIARIRLKAEMQMVQRAENLLVRTETVRAAKAVRPVNLSQDEAYARAEARRQLISGVILETANAACRGSAAKLEKQIERARREADRSSGAR